MIIGRSKVFKKIYVTFKFNNPRKLQKTGRRGKAVSVRCVCVLALKTGMEIRKQKDAIYRNNKTENPSSL